MAAPSPIRIRVRVRIRIEAVPSPIARPPITTPRTTNEHGLFQRTGAFGES
jgi:hypothetical protein